MNTYELKAEILTLINQLCELSNETIRLQAKEKDIMARCMTVLQIIGVTEGDTDDGK